MEKRSRTTEVCFNTNDGFGTAIIDEYAIKKIAAIALNDVQGVKLLTETGTTAKIKGMIAKNHQPTGGVHTKIEGSSVKISIDVVVEYGKEIPVLIKTVQEKVKASVENMTGLSVTTVNIRVPEVIIEQE